MVLYGGSEPHPTIVRRRGPARPTRAAEGPATAVLAGLSQIRALGLLQCGAVADRDRADDRPGTHPGKRREGLAPGLHAVGAADEFRNRQHGDVAPGRADAIHGGRSAGPGAACAPAGGREPVPGARWRLAADRDGTHREIAKAIAGFANSEGRVIVWGVDCRQNPSYGDVLQDRFRSPVEHYVSAYDAIAR